MNTGPSVDRSSEDANLRNGNHTTRPYPRSENSRLVKHVRDAAIEEAAVEREKPHETWRSPSTPPANPRTMLSDPTILAPEASPRALSPFLASPSPPSPPTLPECWIQPISHPMPPHLNPCCGKSPTPSAANERAFEKSLKPQLHELSRPGPWTRLPQSVKERRGEMATGRETALASPPG